MATRKTTPVSEMLAPRHLWLAGLGLAAVARREAGNAACAALASANAWRGRASSFAGDASSVVRGGALTLREKIEPVLGGLGDAIEARFSPLFIGIGIVGPGAARAPRKSRRPAAKKAAAARRTPRKAAPRKARTAR